MEIEDDQGNTLDVEVDESVGVKKAVENKGNVQDIQGLRINNIKYHLSSSDNDEGIFYYRAVILIKFYYFLINLTLFNFSFFFFIL